MDKRFIAVLTYSVSLRILNYEKSGAGNKA